MKLITLRYGDYVRSHDGTVAYRLGRVMSPSGYVVFAAAVPRALRELFAGAGLDLASRGGRIASAVLVAPGELHDASSQLSRALRLRDEGRIDAAHDALASAWSYYTRAADRIPGVAGREDDLGRVFRGVRSRLISVTGTFRVAP